LEGVTPSPVNEALIAASAATALTLTYSAPTPGIGSRYADSVVAYEARVLSAVAARDALALVGETDVGQTVLDATSGALSLTGYADPRAVGCLAPLARAALTGEPIERVLRRLGQQDLGPFARALEAAGEGGPLIGSLRFALGAGKETTLREAMRFAAARDALAAEYARAFEVTRQLARPALLSALSRGTPARGAIVQIYLEVLSEVPDLTVVDRAGRKESEEVSRMAKGVIKSGGVHSSRGLTAIANLDGILREDPRLAPTSTEPLIAAAAFLVAIEYGPGALSGALRPATPGR
jgi:triphosphoribosyl-dephospho-CoA synthase